MKNKRKGYQVAFTGLLFALACVLSGIESVLAVPLMLPPGIKLGLANIVVMYAFLLMSRKTAFLLVLLKASFAFLIRGGTAFLLSLSGGLFSFAVMLLVYSLTKGKTSLFFLSMISAAAHNMGQLAAASALLNKTVFGYAPVLLIAGFVVGGLNAVLLKAMMPALKKIEQKGKEEQR